MEYKSKILNTFSSFLNSENYVVTNEDNSSIKISNKKCAITFFIEFSNLFIDIHALEKDATDSIDGYSLNILYYVLTQKTTQSFNKYKEYDEKINAQIEYYFNIITNELHPLCDNLYSCIPLYEKYLANEKLIRKKVSELPSNHPIFLKYLAGDESWKNDIINI
jgi:hypothetical protein